MAVPNITPEQRRAALEKAAKVRRERAELKEQLKSGAVSLASVLERAKTDSVVGKMKVKALLESLPGIGTAKAQTLMENVGISEIRRVAGLGAVQQEKLMKLLA